MCVGIALAWSELPTELIGRHGLERRVHERGGEREVRFLLPRPPAPAAGLARRPAPGRALGQRPGPEPVPARAPAGPGWRPSSEGGWRNSGAIPVDIPATLGLERGVWYRVRQGIRGLLVPDERGIAVAYMICEPATHYYQVMTRSPRMPVLIEERI